jgi:hypothetical protein
MDFPYTVVKELVGDDKCRTGLEGVASFGQNKVSKKMNTVMILIDKHLTS